MNHFYAFWVYFPSLPILLITEDVKKVKPLTLHHRQIEMLAFLREAVPVVHCDRLQVGSFPLPFFHHFPDVKSIRAILHSRAGKGVL